MTPTVYSAENGILLSLGSWITNEVKPQEFFENIANAFRNLPQSYIWKTRKENTTRLPDNVMVVQWMPQRDILSKVISNLVPSKVFKTSSGKKN